MLDPWESASVAWWLEQAAACVQDIESRGRTALFVGGTTLYLKALLYGLFDGPPGDEALRARLREEAQRDGNPAFHARLAAVDPESAARLHPNDLRRIIRALEVHELTGKPMSAWQTQWRPAFSRCTGGPPVDPGAAQLHRRAACTTTRPRKKIVACAWTCRARSCIVASTPRVKQMFADGLVEEVRALRRLDRPLSREAGQALGYKELFRCLDGEATLDEAMREVQMRSRNYAKRQLTAFRHIEKCRMVSGQLTFALWGSRMEEGKG